MTVIRQTLADVEREIAEAVRVTRTMRERGVRSRAGYPNVVGVTQIGRANPRAVAPGQNDMARATYFMVKGMNDQIIGALTYATQVSIYDVAAKAILRGAGALPVAAAEFVSNNRRLQNRRAGLETLHRNIGRGAQRAIVNSYTRRVKGPKSSVSYRPDSRLTGRMLNALKRDDFIEASRDGIGLGNEFMLDRVAAHWRRLNYGTLGGIPQRPRPRFPISMGGSIIGTLSDQTAPSPAFSMPVGLWIDLASGNVVPFGSRSAKEGFFPLQGIREDVPSTRNPQAVVKSLQARLKESKRQQRQVIRGARRSRGIQGYRFLDAGLLHISREYPEALQTKMFDWLEESRAALKPVNVTVTPT